MNETEAKPPVNGGLFLVLLAALGLAAITAALGFIVYSVNQRGLGLAILAIPVAIVMAAVGVAGLGMLRRFGRRLQIVAISMVVAAVVVLGVIAAMLITTPAWQPPEPATWLGPAGDNVTAIAVAAV